MHTQPSKPAQRAEPKTATGRSTHSKTHERWMGLPFVLETDADASRGGDLASIRWAFAVDG